MTLSAFASCFLALLPWIRSRLDVIVYCHHIGAIDQAIAVAIYIVLVRAATNNVVINRNYIGTVHYTIVIAIYVIFRVSANFHNVIEIFPILRVHILLL